MIRVFVAVPLPEELRKRLGLIQGILSSGLAGVKWVPPGNIHLTLKFLGEITPESPEAIGEALSGIAAARAPFEATAEGIGVFPDVRRPRVIWAGVTAGAEAVKALAEAVEAEMFRLGFPREHRGYSPHLTLGRLKRPSGGITRLLEKAAKEPLGSFSVDVIGLFRSELSPEGARYRLLDRYFLSGGRSAAKPASGA